MYRDDDQARSERANALIDEIAELERQKLAQATTEQRLAAARLELQTLQVTPVPAAPEHRPSVLVHIVVFATTAMATFVGYTLLM